MEATKRYIVHFRKHEKLMDFAVQELQSLASLFKVPVDSLFPQKPENLKQNPLVWVCLQSDQQCKQIMTRSIMIKDIIQVFGHNTMPRVESDKKA